MNQMCVSVTYLYIHGEGKVGCGEKGGKRECYELLLVWRENCKVNNLYGVSING